MATVHYYVDPVNGSDGNAGTSDATAWQTINYAITNTAGTSTQITQVNLKSNGTHTLTATAALSGGGNLGAHVLRGYSSVAGDGGIATIDCDALYGISMLDYSAAADLYMINRGTGSFLVGAYSDKEIRVFNCGFNGATGNAIDFSNNASYAVERCYFTNVSITVQTDAGIETTVSRCFAQDGDTTQFTTSAFSSQMNLIGNMAYVTGTRSGLTTIYNGSKKITRNNSVFSDGGTGTGINQAGNSTAAQITANNAVEGFSGAGGHGMSQNASNFRLHQNINNVVYGNHTDYDTGVETNNLWMEAPKVATGNLFQGGTLPSPALFASDNAQFWQTVHNFFRPTDALIAQEDSTGVVAGAVPASASTVSPSRHPLARF